MTIGVSAKKKIIFVITKSNWGGAQRYVFDMARAVPKDHGIAVVACGGSGDLVGRLKEQGVSVISIPQLERDIGFLKELRSLGSLRRIFAKERPDIVHLNSSKAGGLGALAARISGVPLIIFTAHGWPFSEDRNILSRSVIWTLSWLTALFSHRVIVITKKDLRATRFFPFVSQKKIVYIPIGIDEKDIHFLGREAARTELHLTIPESAVVIGAITEFTPNKGVRYLVEAMEALPGHVHAVLIGGGEEETAMKKMSAAGAAADRIHFAGFRTGASRYLAAFDIFVFPSLKEGIPYAILEAGLAELPIIASNIGGIPDIITDGKDGSLVEVKNAEALAEKIYQLEKDPAMRARFARSIRETIISRFSKEAMINATKKVYGL